MLSSLPSRTTRASEHSDLQLPMLLLLLHRHNLNRLLLPKRETVVLVGFRNVQLKQMIVLGKGVALHVIFGLL